MSKAKPTSIKTNKAGQIFAKIKNGNIYRLNANVNPAESASVVARIKDAGAINLKHWTKVETNKNILQLATADRKPQPAKQESQPALRNQYLAVWEKRCSDAYDRLNTKKLEGMVARKEAKLDNLKGDPKGLRQIIQQELDIALEYLRDAYEQQAVAS